MIVLNMKANRNSDIEDGCLDNDVSNLSFKTNNADTEKISRNQSNDHLSELEHQVESAEVRCDTLKQQLEFMRTLYQDRLSQYQTELEKGNDYEESIFSPESDSSFVERQIEEHAKVISPTIMEDKCIASSILPPAVDFKYSSISDCNFQECNDVCKELTHGASSPELTVNNDMENHCHNTSKHDNFQSLVIGPLDHSFNAKSINLVPKKSDYDNNVLQSMENDSTADNYETSLNDYTDANSDTDNNVKPLNGCIDLNETMDSVLDLETSNGMNPVETIQGIINGITNSVNIISQLSVHASDSGKKKYTQKRTHKKETLSCTSKKSALYHIEKPKLLPEKQTISHFLEENVVVENSFEESRHSLKKKCHRHHHHNNHHHHCNYHRTCSRHHKRSHHEDSLSNKSNFPTSDQMVHSKSDSLGELIYDSYHLKQKNRFKEHKQRSENRSREKSLNELKKSLAVKQNSSPDFSRNIPKSKSKHSKAGKEQLPNTTQKETSKRDSGGKQCEYILADTKQDRKKQSKVRSTRSQLLITDTRENRQSGDSNCYSMVKIVKNDFSKSYLNGKAMKRQCDVISSQSAFKNKAMNNGKPGEKKQTSSIIIERNFDSNPAAQEPNGKLRNEHISSFPFSHCEETPNFSVPTLSSKLKQVEKPMGNLFNFRNIPFVAGTSTSRSHNLALNLQQALSIIKLRSSSLSIGSDLATEVASSIFGPQSRPSSAGPCVPHKIFCPVAMAQMKNLKTHVDLNSEYPIFDGRNEKMAFYEGDSATETFDSLSKSEIEAGNFQSSSFSHLRQKENVWEVEQAEDMKSVNGSLRCTCFPTRPCMDYQKLLFEYLSNGDDTQVAQLVLHSNDKRETNASQNTLRIKHGEMTQPLKSHNFIKDTDIALDGRDHPIYGQIQARSKELKEVLMNMHRDFIKLNEKYESLHNQLESPNVNGIKATKELEYLESELEAKENDIAVILGLHKQLMSLKQQVKTLRMKTNSQFIVPPSPVTPIMLPREPTVSVRLTRLLRTIQKFQEKLLNE